MLGAGPNPPRYIPTLTEVVDPLPLVEPVPSVSPPEPAPLDGLPASVNASAEAEVDVEQVLSRLTDQLARQIEQRMQVWCQEHARSLAEQCLREIEPMLREAWLPSRGGLEKPGSGPIKDV